MNKLTTEEIKALPRAVRLAGYLLQMAIADEIGARLRTSKEDEDWTEGDNERWYASVNETEPWYDALSEEELKVLKPVTNFTACLCRGEDVLDENELPVWLNVLQKSLDDIKARRLHNHEDVKKELL